MVNSSPTTEFKIPLADVFSAFLGINIFEPDLIFGYFLKKRKFLVATILPF